MRLLLDTPCPALVADRRRPPRRSGPGLDRRSCPRRAGQCGLALGIVVKARIGKLDADITNIGATLNRDGFTRHPIAPSHLTALACLPRHPDHRDPFDHLLIAQAVAEDATFLSGDRNTARYPVRAMPCLNVAA